MNDLKQPDALSYVESEAVYSSPPTPPCPRCAELERDVANWKAAMYLLSADKLGEELVMLKRIHDTNWAMAKSVWKQHEAQFADARKRIAELEKALEPFADMAQFYTETFPGDYRVASASKDGKTSYYVTLADCRAARAALAKGGQQ